MIRKITKKVRVGSVNIGAAREPVVKSMTKVPTVEVERCIRQANRPVQAGGKFESFVKS